MTDRGGVSVTASQDERAAAVESGPLLRFTGHPLADVAAATVCALVERERPEDVTLEDLDRVADEIERHYFGGAMDSYLTCVFMNSAYAPPNNKAKQQAEYRTAVVRAHRAAPDADVEGLTCAYSGRPASFAAQRTHVPLLAPAGSPCFHPAGRTFLPLSGAWVVALQTLPLGARRSQGKLLAVWSDDRGLLLRFARRFVDDNRRFLALHAELGCFPPADDDGSALPRGRAVADNKTKRGKYPDASSPGSIVTDELQAAAAEQAWSAPGASVVAYWLSNSGQGPSLELLPVSSALVRFLRRANAAPLGGRWRRLVARSWRGVWPKGGKRTKPKRGETPRAPNPGGPGRSRNALLEDLRLVLSGPGSPDGAPDRSRAAGFVRRHLLPRREPEDVAGGVVWGLVSLFLEEVLGMDRARIEAIKGLADRLAEYVARTNDRQAFRAIVTAKGDRALRGAVVRVQRREAQAGRLLVGLEQFVEALVADDALGRLPWELSRDLVAVRLIERLHVEGWFGKHPDALEGVDPKDGAGDGDEAGQDGDDDDGDDETGEDA